MAELGTGDSSTGNDSDQDFDPTADMLVNDFDDEHTLDEEEALDEANNDSEIDDLQRESEMPLEELLALYRYAPPPTESDKANVSSSTPQSIEVQVESSKTGEESVEESTSQNNFDENTSRLNQIIGSSSGDLISDDEDDEEYEDDLSESGHVSDWRKTIQIGQEFQADVSETINLNHNDQDEDLKDGQQFNNEKKIKEQENTLLWFPHLNNKQILEYYKRFAIESSDTNLKGISVAPENVLSGNTNVRDNEIALWILMKSDYIIEDALKIQNTIQFPNESTEKMRSWSQAECKQFEEGLKLYGKDFFLIKKNMLPERPINEIVHFYYLWKKTERHDLFAGKWRVEKKKYSLHPSITDYMDKFLDEQEQHASLGAPTASSASAGNAKHAGGPSSSLPTSGFLHPSHGLAFNGAIPSVNGDALTEIKLSGQSIESENTSEISRPDSSSTNVIASGSNNVSSSTSTSAAEL